MAAGLREQPDWTDEFAMMARLESAWGGDFNSTTSGYIAVLEDRKDDGIIFEALVVLGAKP